MAGEQRRRRADQLLGQGLVDGVLLMEVQLEDARVEVLRATRTPFALIGRSADLSGLVYVDIDFERTMEEAVDHLVGLGHRRLVLVTGSQAEASYRSYGPYVRAARPTAGSPRERGFEGVILECEQAPRPAARSPRRSWPRTRRTTAVLVLNEFAAPGLVSACCGTASRVPDDVSVLSVLTSTEMSTRDRPRAHRDVLPRRRAGRARRRRRCSAGPRGRRRPAAAPAARGLRARRLDRTRAGG